MKTTAKQILTKAKLNRTYWGRKVIAAENRGGFSDSDSWLAGVWTTCACGKQDRRIPRDDVDAPIDRKLASAGRSFDCHVSLNNTVAAARTLVAIEKRAAIVLKKVLAK